MTLKAKVDLTELGPGRHELGFSFTLRGLDGRDGRSRFYLYCDQGIDAKVVQSALGAGVNPIMAVLLSQPDVAKEFFHGGGGGLHSWLERQALESDVPAATKARSGDSGRL